jgi:hypothetical protein
MLDPKTRISIAPTVDERLRKHIDWVRKQK